MASFIAQIDISQQDAVIAGISAIPGAEIHIKDPSGKIIFTIESANQRDIGNYADDLKDQPGLLTLAPVYHQYLEE